MEKVKVKFIGGVADRMVIELDCRCSKYIVPFEPECALSELSEPWNIRCDAWGIPRVVRKTGKATYVLDKTGPTPIARFESSEINEYPGKDDWKAAL
jgi:hypothetical protein